jgi:formylglycine-generating enzyme required for sulfatase activity
VDATDDTGVGDAADDAAPPDAGAEASPGDAAPEDGAGGCPAEMVPVMGACLDRYEAPNVAGALPLVMYTFTEGEAWCAARGKRLCFDDEWQTACEGPDLWAYPYGATQVPGECNDDKVWRTYNQTLLNGWPPSASSTTIGSLADLFAAARAVSTTAAAAADHVESLYQGEGSGTSTGCVGAAGAYDLCGNVEEWTRRRDGGEPQFHGKLKGRYWAESRTCQSGVTTHGDAFRFYEIGFRCCRDL